MSKDTEIKPYRSRGKFIVIEGVDGSGKTTQFDLLYDRIKETQTKIMVVDFPRYYKSIWGKMVGELLIGKYGKFKDVDPHLAVLLYMLDQYTWSRDIGRPWIAKGGWILANRYFTSNVHQIAKLKGGARTKFRNWLWPSGYDDLGIVKPDRVIFLDVSPKVSLKMNKMKKERQYLNGKKQDLAERDREHQKAAYHEYLRTVTTTSYWTKVRCVAKGVTLSPEVIHERVWIQVEKLFK
jgi:dTMP kinase